MDSNSQQASRADLKAKLRQKQQQARQRAGGSARDTAAISEALLSLEDPEALRVATEVLRKPSTAMAQLTQLMGSLEAPQGGAPPSTKEAARPQHGEEEDEDEEAPVKKQKKEAPKKIDQVEAKDVSQEGGQKRGSVSGQEVAKKKMKVGKKESTEEVEVA